MTTALDLKIKQQVFPEFCIIVSKCACTDATHAFKTYVFMIREHSPSLASQYAFFWQTLNIKEFCLNI